MDINIFEQAARNQTRFQSIRGPLTVEQLFTLPLQAKDGFDLDSVAKAVNRELNNQAEESFVARSSNPKKAQLELAMQIVLHVIETRQQENAQRVNDAKRQEETAKLKDIINRKQDSALEGESLEVLQKRLAELSKT